MRRVRGGMVGSVGRGRGVGSGGVGRGMAVVILPGIEVNLGDGDGVAGHDGVSEK
jgi:hypothetical protein